MPTYLLAWNPNRWSWKTLDDDCAVVRRGGTAHERQWSCGKSKTIARGSHFYLIRLGLDPKGIIGFGKIVSVAYEDHHWETARKSRGDTAWFVDIEFQWLSRDPVIGWDLLKAQDIAGGFRTCPMPEA